MVCKTNRGGREEQGAEALPEKSRAQTSPTI